MRIFTLLFLLITVIGCARTRILEGHYLFAPAKGETKVIEWVKFRKDLFYLKADNFALAGMYELHERNLVMVKPDNPRMKPVVIAIEENGELKVTEAPPITASDQALLASRFSAFNK